MNLRIFDPGFSTAVCRIMMAVVTGSRYYKLNARCCVLHHVCDVLGVTVCVLIKSFHNFHFLFISLGCKTVVL